MLTLPEESRWLGETRRHGLVRRGFDKSVGDTDGAKTAGFEQFPPFVLGSLAAIDE